MTPPDTDWRQLEKTLQQAQSELGLYASPLLPGGKQPAPPKDEPAAGKVDEVCRHFAEQRQWPEKLDDSMKEAVARRTLFATMAIKTLQSAKSKLAQGPEPGNAGTESLSQRQFLEWLLIQSWKAGGTKIMEKYLGAVVNALDGAGMAAKLGLGEPPAANSPEGTHARIHQKELHGVKFPVLSNEEARLRALWDYEVFGADAQQAYDGITFIASHICEMPMSVITLVDRETQWFKSAHGIAARHTPREWAFCNHTIVQQGPFVLSDSHQDPRFASNPLVTGAPYIRFYAGAPMITPEGFALGSVCVADTEPRKISDTQIRALEALASQAMAQMEYRRTGKALAAEMANVRNLQGLLPVCAHCHGVRDDGGYWTNVSDYIHTHPETLLGKCICRACTQKTLRAVPGDSTINN